MSKNKEIINETPVVLKQNAIIDYSGIDRIIESTKARIDALDIENIEANEENKSSLKKLRAELNKELREYENARKYIKKIVEQPYKDFEVKYKVLKEVYDDASSLLRDKIDEVEDAQREEKKNNLVIYFNELKVSLNETIKELGFNLDFVSFNQLGLNITVSASETSLRKQANETLERVCNDLRVISGNAHKSRLYAKYSVNLDLSRALVELQEELKRVEQIIESAKPKVESEVDDTKANVDGEVEANVVEEIITLNFEIDGTKTEIAQVRQFLIDNEISYRMLNKKGERIYV